MAKQKIDKRMLNFMERYEYAKKYYEEHGDLLIPSNYVVNGIKLGVWIKTLRYNYHKGILKQEYITLLEKIDMSWDGVVGIWEKKFKILEEYYLLYGDINVGDNYIFKGINLTIFIETQRSSYANGTLDERKVKLLEGIGMIWGHDDNWNHTFAEVEKVYQIHKTLDFDDDFIVNGKSFNRWRYYQVSSYLEGKLSEEKISKLKSVGFILDWDQMYILACEYYKENSNLLLEQFDGELGSWLFAQRNLYHKGLLDRDKIIKLNNIGMLWFVKNSDINFKRSRILLIETLKLIRNELDKPSECKKMQRKINYK